MMNGGCIGNGQTQPDGRRQPCCCCCCCRCRRCRYCCCCRQHRWTTGMLSEMTDSAELSEILNERKSHGAEEYFNNHCLCD